MRLLGAGSLEHFEQVANYVSKKSQEPEGCEPYITRIEAQVAA